MLKLIDKFKTKWGDYLIPTNNPLEQLMVIATIEPEWEHVTVRLENRTPTWDEMKMVKELFWDDEDTVVQFHPKKSEYVNESEYCLHLWRKRNEEYNLPPLWVPLSTNNQEV